ncbi:uncharacterized protein BDZ99DRAFT_575202 [Mytilinidion resinicola]|uniref:Uncharacterized protein n=1 Tax=Mytilinidion resinicola TaxID=574789 RepID=A0A6A6Y6U6_9PEZI|nr:uncharacterized protein BDZ99DRAFT_575202 [Mytilinidion resinicola]KAF2804546.1 hypothetical protein BDZ99DRAFT_575202 [Mytilinidion resinicola]
MVNLGETITVINKSGKVVSSSKHLINVFKEAKSAYRERKAEIKAERNAAFDERKAIHGIKTMRIEDDVRSRASSKHSRDPRRSKSHHHSKSPLERGYTDSFYENDDRPLPRRPTHRRMEDEVEEVHRRELLRRHTDGPVTMARHISSHSNSEPHIDMDLAYGELPPPLPSPRYNDGELREKANKLTMLLDEANCLQYSVTAMIENLQKNPEALAAVALTLGEISNILTKMGPGVLTALKGSFPAVVALLASPQFMIAAGVGVGVTIIALGGYKVIRKIRAKKEAEAELEEPLEMDQLETAELSRIEIWQRGIAEAEVESRGTTVDGEFITPGASRQLIAEGVLQADDLKSRRSERRSRSHAPKSTHSSKSHRSSTSRSGKEKSKEKVKPKKREPSGLRMLFSPSPVRPRATA